MNTNKKKLISIVISCYYSEKMLKEVVLEIVHAMDQLVAFDYQLVLVNDGSTDLTFPIIVDLVRNHPKIIGVNLSKNFGQNQARLAGLRYVNGDIIVFMDDDGQHPPEGIILLANSILEGNDVAYARFNSKHHSLFKRTSSRLNAKILEIMKRKPKGIAISSFYSIDKYFSNCLKEYLSPYASPLGYLMQITQNFANVDIDHRSRISGKSGYSFKKLLNLAIVGMTSFTVVPLRLIVFIGLILLTGSLVYGIACLIGIISSSLSSLMLPTFLLLLLGGLIMLSLGVVGEYIGNMYMIISGKPQFSIKEVISGSCFNED